MAYRSVGVGTSVTIPNPAAAAVQTDYFDVQTETIRLVASRCRLPCYCR
jgi:hypothetical protein